MSGAARAQTPLRAALVAMGNAGAEVRRAAHCVTTSYDDEGFANAVERYLLSDKERHP